MRFKSGTTWVTLVAALALISVTCGSTADTYLNDTWTWDGSHWKQATAGGSPAWRFGALFVYDEAAHQVTMFGGQDAEGKVLSDTWTWDGRWKLQHPTLSPPARLWPAAAYDSTRGEIVMFGGSKGPNAGEWDDTWTWDGHNWNQKTVTGSTPPAQSFGPSGAAFDPASKRVVLVNDGLCLLRPGEVCPPDTWVWDGTRWLKRLASAPETNRSGIEGVLYADVSRNRVTMLQESYWTFSGAAFTWNGTSWTALPGTTEAQISFGALAYDAGTSSLITFGGGCAVGSGNRSAATAEMWSTDGSQWAKLTPPTAPPARSQTYLAYDSGIGSLVMFGGWVQGKCGSGVLP